MHWRRALIVFGFVLCGGIVVSTAVIARHLTPENEELQWDLSPDGRVVAEVVEDLQSSATSTDYVSVELTRPGEVWKAESFVFGGDDYGGKVSLRWLNANNLLITCTGCKEGPNGEMPTTTALHISNLEQRWQDVSIWYAFED